MVDDQPPLVGTEPIDDLDAWARRRGVEATLSEVDRQVLRPSGRSDGEITSLRAIWRKAVPASDGAEAALIGRERW